MSATERPSRVDPITLSVIWGSLQSITVEVGTTVHRTAHSPAGPRGPGLLRLPLRSARAAWSPRARTARVTWGRCRSPPRTRWRPSGRSAPAGRRGAVQQPLPRLRALPDFFMSPARVHRRRAGSSGSSPTSSTTPTWAVCGPGSQAVEGVFDYFQEGLHVPPVKPWKGGEEQEDILAIILANTRMAEVDAGRPARPAELAPRRASSDGRARRAGTATRSSRRRWPRSWTGPRPRCARRSGRSRTESTCSRTTWTTRGPARQPMRLAVDGHRPRRRHPDRLRRHGTARPSRG